METTQKFMYEQTVSASSWALNTEFISKMAKLVTRRERLLRFPKCQVFISDMFSSRDALIESGNANLTGQTPRCSRISPKRASP